MKVWELVKDIEEDKENNSNELGEAKATMLVNFGPEGRCVPGLVDEHMKLPGMIFTVFEYYENKSKDGKNDFCACGQIKHVGHDQCIDCLDMNETDKQ